MRMLQQNGVQPDIIVCRTEHPIPMDIKKKVALFCNVRPNAVIESIDAKSIYEVPLLMHKEKLDEIVLKRFGLEAINNTPDLTKWKGFWRDCSIQNMK